jgi:hypothetical protein
VGAAGGLASTEHVGPVLGDEQRQGHGAGCGQPAAPRRPGRVHVQVQRDVLAGALTAPQLVLLVESASSSLSPRSSAGEAK